LKGILGFISQDFDIFGFEVLLSGLHLLLVLLSFLLVDNDLTLELDGLLLLL